MSETPIRVEVGQVWRSRDRRELDVTARVLEVDGDGLYDGGFALIQRYARKSRIRLTTLRSRYRLEVSS